MLITAPIAVVPAELRQSTDRIAWPQLRKALRRHEVMLTVCAYPGESRNRIAKRCGQSVAHVARHLEALVEQHRIRAVRVDREINYYPEVA